MTRRLFEDTESWLDDLLLSDAERAAWQACLLAPPADPTGEDYTCDLVIERTEQSLVEGTPHNGLLDLALHHLTLARALLYKAVRYSDASFLKELLKHLRPYVRSGVVTGWSDQQITAGAKWFREIQVALGKTSVAVLLVSPDFLASEFIHEQEFGPLLKKAEEESVKILWIQLRACAFEETPLKDYQAVVSPPEKPLAQWRRAERDRAWVRVCKEIKNAVGP